MRGRLYLYLAIACFIGLVSILIIFGVNSRWGVYDTIYVTAGEREWTAGPCRILEDIPESPLVKVECGGVVHFRYELSNRRLSPYSAPLQASLWVGDVKAMELFSQDVRIKPFGKVIVEWDFDTKELKPHELGCDVEECTVKVQQGEVERDIIVDTRCFFAIWIIPVEVDAQTEYWEVEGIIKSMPWVTEVTQYDSYYNATTGNATFYIEIHLQSLSHNLTDEELLMVEEQMIAALRQELGVS